MSETVTVALLGNTEHAFDNQAFTWHEHGAKELDEPWDALPKVVLEVEPSETIHDVLTRALHDSGIRLPDYVDPEDPPISWILFREEGVAPAYRRFVHELVIADDDGRARWGVHYKSVTYERLLRSAGAGTIQGDPRQAYLILYPPAGNGAMATWSALLEGLRIAQHVLEAMATAGGAAAFGKLVLDTARDRLRNGREVLQDRYLEWDERGARPDNFERFLGLGPWHSTDLAERLGCSDAEAEAILWSYGYAPAASGVWRRDGDDAARLVHMVNDDLALTEAWNPGATFEREMRRRAEGLVTVGEPLPEPTWERDDEPEPEEEPLTIGQPIEGVRLQCGCGRAECAAELEFYRSGFGEFDQLVLSFEPHTNHFALDPAVLGALLGTLARGM